MKSDLFVECPKAFKVGETYVMEGYEAGPLMKAYTRVGTIAQRTELLMVDSLGCEYAISKSHSDDGGEMASAACCDGVKWTVWPFHSLSHFDNRMRALQKCAVVARVQEEMRQGAIDPQAPVGWSYSRTSSWVHSCKPFGEVRTEEELLDMCRTFGEAYLVASGLLHDVEKRGFPVVMADLDWLRLWEPVLDALASHFEVLLSGFAMGHEEAELQALAAT